MNCLGSVKRGSLFNLIGLRFGGKGRLLLLNCGLIVFEDFSPPQQRLGFLKEVLSEEERGGLLLFSSSWGLGCHVTLWMNFSSVLAVSIKTLLSGWEIGINLFPCGRCNINCLSQLQQINFHLLMGTVGVVYTSLSGVKSYD